MSKLACLCLVLCSARAALYAGQAAVTLSRDVAPVNNPVNPDPKKAVRWGAASESEMMDGWIEYVDVETATPGQHVRNAVP